MQDSFPYSLKKKQIKYQHPESTPIYFMCKKERSYKAFHSHNHIK